MELKTYLEWLAEKGVDETAYSEKSPKEMAQLQKEYLQYVSTTMKESNKDILTLDGLKSFIEDEANKDLFPKADISGFKERIEEAEEAIKLLKESGSSGDRGKTLEQVVKEHITENKEEWERLKTDRNHSFKFETKAVTDMLVSTNTTGRVARIEVDPERVGVARRNPFVMDAVRTSQTNAATIYWVEREAHEGTPVFTAEGAAKPKIDWEYVERSRPVRKIPAYTKISKEMMDDIDGIAADISLELTEQILLAADASLLTGDGTSNTLVGIAENATAFAPGTALANTVEAANDYDALRAAIAQVYRNNFTPNTIFVHPDKVASMEMAKGTDGHYVMPPFKAADGTTIAGVRVVANNGVAADAFYVGDMSKYKVKVREGISIEIGYDGNDWTKNMVTPLAEMRLCGYIASNDYGAIVSGTFTVAKALLDPDVADS